MENDATGFQNPPNLLVFSPPADAPRRALRMASPRCSRGSSRGACSRVVAALACSALALVVLASAGFSRRGAPSGPLGAGSLLLRSKPGTRRGAPFSTPRAAREAEAGSALAAFEAARSACAARGSGICPVCGACVDAGAWKPHRGRANASCPFCGAKERHRVAALVELRALPPSTLRPPTTPNPSPSPPRPPRGPPRPLPRGPRVAYFGPEKPHAEFLRARGAEVVGLDFFAPGYGDAHYDEHTRFADLSGASCPDDENACVPLPDASVDGVVLMHVIEHLPSAHFALRAAERVAKDGAWAQIEVPCDRERKTAVCRDRAFARARGFEPIRTDSNRTSNESKTDMSPICRQPDHLVAYNCAAFRAAVERSGAWRCADAGDAAGFFSSHSGESGKSGEKKKTDESDALRAFGLSEASVQWGNQLLCERAPRRDE